MIYDQNYNPDYPVAGDWRQHSYMQEQNNGSFWYAGSGVGPTFTPAPAVYPDSRRNDGYAQYNAYANQYQAYQQALQNPQMAYQNAPVMPNMTNAPTAPAFNALAESRRYDQTPTNVGNNPWAQQAQQQAQQIQAQQQQFVPAAPVQPNYWGSMTYEPSCSALYRNYNFNMDRSQSSWDIPDQNRAVVPPTINWNQPVQPYAQNQYAMPVQPTFNIPQTPMSWSDVANKNWNMNK